MLGTLLATAALCLAAVAVGAALLRLCRLPPRAGYGPALGLATLLVIANVAIKHHGRADTVIVVALIAIVASVVVAWRDLRRLSAAEVVVAGLVVLTLTLVPFVASDRFGLLGMGINNDMATHLSVAASINTASQLVPIGLGGGYPVGPHALVASLAQLLGIGADQTFTALLIAVPLLAVPTAVAALEHLTRPRRALAAVLVALPYLVASYYAEAAFKETIEALFVLVFALLLRDAARIRPFDVRALVPFGIVGAACVANYSYFGLGWLAATLAVWIALQVMSGALQPRAAWRRVRENSNRRTALTAAAVVVILAIPLAPEGGRAVSLFRTAGFSPSGSGAITTSNQGNLVGQLSPYEATGIWPHADFRFYPVDDREAVRTGALGVFGLGAAAFGLIWWLRRRERQVAAAAIASAAIYVALKGGESAYVTAKALVILSPLAMLLALGALLDRWRARPPELELARWAVVGVLVVAALASTFIAVRNAQISTPEPQSELTSFRSIIAGKPTLFLGFDEFSEWYLRTTRTSDPYYHQLVPLINRGGKQAATIEGTASSYGRTFDFDTPAAGQLDHFDYVVTVRTPYASEPPPNFVLRRRTALYELWERRGKTPPRATLSEGMSPGAVLDCSTRVGRALSRKRGSARVLPRPVVTDIRKTEGFIPGGTLVRRVHLPPGRWRLALQYTSPVDFSLTARGLIEKLPGILSRPGPFWPAGEVTVSDRSPLRLELYGRKPNRLTATARGATVGAVAAVRADVPARTVPLSQACGKYLDYYILTS